MKKYMDNSYELLKSLLAQIGESGEWKGESHKAFMAYMDLMNQLYRLTTFYQAAASYLVGTYNTHYQNEEQVMDWIEQYLGAQEVQTDGV